MDSDGPNAESPNVLSETVARYEALSHYAHAGSINSLLAQTITEQDLPNLLYDGHVLCQLMNLYLRKRGHAGIPIRKPGAPEDNIANLEYEPLYFTPMIYVPPLLRRHRI
jgi:hypothetical protein